MLLLDIIGLFTFGFVTAIANVVMAFLYNKLYAEDLISNGFKPTDNASVNILNQKGVAFNGMAANYETFLISVIFVPAVDSNIFDRDSRLV